MLAKNTFRTYFRGLIFILIIFICVACTVQRSSTLTFTEKPNPTAAIIPTLTPQPTETVTQTAAPTILPTSAVLDLTNPRSEILANDLANPDDLVAAPDGSLFISDISEGSIKKLTLDGSIQTIVSGLSVPEGMVYLPDGALIIAEQGKNRLLEYDLNLHNLKTFLNLSNTTNQEGVDGITLDGRTAGAESIIIPDSPNGVLRRSSLDGSSVAVIASGFNRPTVAWVEADGSILVVDENSGYLERVYPDGKKIDSLDFPFQMM